MIAMTTIAPRYCKVVPAFKSIWPTKRFCQTVPTLMAMTEKIEAPTVAGVIPSAEIESLGQKHHGNANEADTQSRPMTRLYFFAKRYTRDQRSPIRGCRPTTNADMPAGKPL